MVSKVDSLWDRPLPFHARLQIRNWYVTLLKGVKIRYQWVKPASYLPGRFFKGYEDVRTEMVKIAKG